MFRIAVTLLPVRVTGEPVTATLAAIVRVPLVVPAVAGAAKTTLMVQVAAAASVVVQVPPPPPPGRENLVVNVRPMPVPAAVPVLCNVSVCVALVVPDAVLKVNGPPVTLSTAFPVAAVAVPANATGKPVTGTLAAIVREPMLDPAVAGALKTTLMVQVEAGASVAVQVPPAAGRENGPVNVRAIPVAPAVPVLLNVSVCAALVVLTVAVKVNAPGVTL